MFARPATRLQHLPLVAIAVVAMAVVAILRYNVPEGSFGA